MRSRRSSATSGSPSRCRPRPDDDTPPCAISNDPPPSSALTPALLGAFHAGMREAGLDENVDYVLEARYGDGRAERYPELAAQAAAGRPDVLVAAGTPAALALQTATATTPIVMI